MIPMSLVGAVGSDQHPRTAGEEGSSNRCRECLIQRGLECHSTRRARSTSWQKLVSVVYFIRNARGLAQLTQYTG